MRYTHLVVDDAEDGFALYRLEGAKFIRRLANRYPSINTCPKQVAFGESGKVVVGGSDHGRVYVFDKDTGELRETLIVCDGHSLQTIAVSILLRSYLDPTLISHRLTHTTTPT